MNTTQEPTTGYRASGAEAQSGSYAQGPSAAPPAGAYARDPRAKSPALAAVLSAFPGLGQVYVGYYQRGFINALVIAGLITLLASGQFGTLIPLIALFMSFYWLYNIIDAARRATFYNEALLGRSVIDPPREFEKPGRRGSIAGGVSLFVAGTLLLMNTRFGMSLVWIEDWWPAGLMLFGAYLVYRAVQERPKTPSSE